MNSSNHPQEPTTPLLEAINVSREFVTGGRSCLALAPTSVSVNPGELLVITGPSGSGKSTLLNLLSGLDSPTAGEVFFAGSRLSSKAQGEIAAIRNESFGFIFQTPHLLQDKTVIENIGLPFHYGKQLPQAAILDRCRKLLAYTGLTDLADRYPSTLSGGEMQRVVFARALVRKPSIIFADEPTGSLDSGNSIQIMTLLKKQAEAGQAAIMVSHDPLSEQFASRVMHLTKSGTGDSHAI